MLLECCILNQWLLRKAKIWCLIPAAVKSRNVSNIRQRTTWPSLPWALCISHPPSSGCLTHSPFSAPSARATPVLCSSPTQTCSPLAASASSSCPAAQSNSASPSEVSVNPLLWPLPPAKASFLLLLLLSAKIYHSQGTVMKDMNLFI